MLVKGKPREDILGLPHTEEGYDEAITSIYKLKNIREFCNKLDRTVQTLTTMKKLNSAQCLVYTLMDKLEPVREIIAQQDDNWGDWNLEELVENMKRYVERNQLQNK